RVPKARCISPHGLVKTSRRVGYDHTAADQLREQQPVDPTVEVAIQRIRLLQPHSAAIQSSRGAHAKTASAFDAWATRLSRVGIKRSPHPEGDSASPGGGE